MNPKCRSGTTSYETVSQALARHGFRILNTAEHEKEIDPNKIILKYQNQADVVIVGGGDGSVNLVLPSLIKLKLPLMVIPLGTANNLARTFDLPTDPEASIDLLKKGNSTLIDLGVVNDILFVNVAGLGLSTEINRKVPTKLKRYLGVLAFILTGLRLIFRMNPFRASITCHKAVIHTKSWQISVCNGKHYGAGMTIKHNASLEDEKLHLLSTEVDKWWKGFSLIPSLMTGHYNRNQEITLLSGNEIKIETRRKLHIDVDGDIKTTTPATFGVIPQALRLIVPEEK